MCACAPTWRRRNAGLEAPLLWMICLQPRILWFICTEHLYRISGRGLRGPRLAAFLDTDEINTFPDNIGIYRPWLGWSPPFQNPACSPYMEQDQTKEFRNEPWADLAPQAFRCAVLQGGSHDSVKAAPGLFFAFA